jgi:hypothetical protein
VALKWGFMPLIGPPSLYDNRVSQSQFADRLDLSS